MLILDFPFLSVSGGSVRDEAMWEGFRIRISERPCARRLDTLCGPEWTSQHCLDGGPGAGWRSQDAVGGPEQSTGLSVPAAHALSAPSTTDWGPFRGH